MTRKKELFTPAQLVDADYVLIEDACWIEVGGFAIRIHKTDEGVITDIFDNKMLAKGEDDLAFMASTYAFDSDLEDAE